MLLEFGVWLHENPMKTLLVTLTNPKTIIKNDMYQSLPYRVKLINLIRCFSHFVLTITTRSISISMKFIQEEPNEESNHPLDLFHTTQLYQFHEAVHRVALLHKMESS